MLPTKQISSKGDEQFLFEVKLNWLSNQKGILSTRDVPEKIVVDTPFLFGGEEKDWSPEHLFLSSISSCFMTTYLAFAKNFNFEISGFECSTIGQIEFVEGRFKFTRINISPKIYVFGEALRRSAKLALDKSQKYCLITNSIANELIYHSEVLVLEQHGKSKSKN